MAEADYEFDSLLIEMCGNADLSRSLNFSRQGAPFRSLTLPLRAKRVYSNVNHAAVVEAVRRNDPETAQDIIVPIKRAEPRLVDLLDRSNLPE